jgi:hypothetical protein
MSRSTPKGRIRRSYVYADISPEEYARLRAIAMRDGLTIAALTRAGINTLLLEQGDDDALLVQRKPGRPCSSL